MYYNDEFRQGSYCDQCDCGCCANHWILCDECIQKLRSDVFNAKDEMQKLRTEIKNLKEKLNDYENNRQQDTNGN